MTYVTLTVVIKTVEGYAKAFNLYVVKNRFKYLKKDYEYIQETQQILYIDLENFSLDTNK